MSAKTEGIWKILLEKGIVQGEAPKEEDLDSPWYVKALLAFSGWLAAAFLFGFIGVGFVSLLSHSGATCAVGMVMIGGAFFILRTSSGEFVEHLGLAMSLAGQALVIYSIFDLTGRNETVAWLLVLFLEIPLAIVVPNFVHRVFSSFTAAIALYMFFIEIGIPCIGSGMVILIAVQCWLNEFRYPQHVRKARGIGYGLILALIAQHSTLLLSHSVLGWRRVTDTHQIWTQSWIGEVVIGAVAIYVIVKLLQRYNKSLTKPLPIAILLGTILICAVSMKVHGLTVGMVILLLGFSGTNRVLLGLGFASLLFYISSYYYLLDTTLLDKSWSLFIVGLVLLAIRWLGQRLVPKGEEIQYV